LGFAIGLLDKARVAQINGDNRNASELCLVGQELAKLTNDAPQTAALRLPGLNPTADVREVFYRSRQNGSVHHMLSQS
jgi:hypothetical protein